MKMTKNDKTQKSSKFIKIQKVRKVTKSENAKVRKSTKWKSEKMSKNSEKKGGTPKTPKCHLNDQNRHFAKSEPPGWALFRFQGVPRDPVLRPKKGGQFLMWKSDHILCFHVLWIVHFIIFSHFMKLINCTFYEVDQFLCIMSLL